MLDFTVSLEYLVVCSVRVVSVHVVPELVLIWWVLSHYILYHYRILCTHHVNYLQEADTVVVLDNGTLKYCGQPSAVLPLVAAEEENKGDVADQESEPKQVSPVKQFHHFCTHHCLMLALLLKSVSTVILGLLQAF